MPDTARVGNDEELGGTEIGCLRGGSWAAVTTGLVMLHARGVLVSGAGRISRTGSVRPDVEPLERALYAALYGSMGPRELASQQRVHRALGEVRRRLVERGLVRAPWRRVLIPVVLVTLPPVLLAQLVALRAIGVIVGLAAALVFVGIAGWFLPRRTLAGARALRALRARHGDIVSRPALQPAEVGVAVALFGTPALLATMPKFARDGGLLDGGRWSRYLGDGPLHSSSHLDASSGGSGGLA